MGRRGPPPTPSRLRIVQGNPGKRPINREEPELPAGEDDDWQPPVHMRNAARREWERQVPALRAAGVLTLADRTMFSEYCIAYGDLRVYEALAARVGQEAAIRLGYAGQVLKLRQQVRQLAADAGLNPSARSGVKAAKAPDKGALGRFTGGAKG